jgi:hypothetical protein
MSKVIFKLKFQSPNFKGTKTNNMFHLIYIGTREGVALNNDLKEITKVNKSTDDEYVKYISDRPRSHGLFTREGEGLNLQEIANELKEYNGYVYRGIISLRENEAIEKGFDKKENWELLLRDKMYYISKQLDIPYNRLKWVGAFHRESGHPHVHFMVWDKENPVRNLGVIPNKNIENIRRELTKDIFENEVEKALSLKNLYRDILVNTTRDIENNFTDEINLLNDKIEEINLKYDIGAYEDELRKIDYERRNNISGENLEEKEMEIIDKSNLAREKLKKFDIKNEYDMLLNQKESLELKSKILELREKNNIPDYEVYLNNLKYSLGIYREEKNRKISINQKNVLNGKKEIYELQQKIKFIELDKIIKDTGIYINAEENTLKPEEKDLIKEYLQLKDETEHIKLSSIYEIENKIEDLEINFQTNKWKLNLLIEEGLLSANDKEVIIESKDIDKIVDELDSRIKTSNVIIEGLREEKLEKFSLKQSFEATKNTLKSIIEDKKIINTLDKYCDFDDIEGEKLNKEELEKILRKIEYNAEQIKVTIIKQLGKDNSKDFIEMLDKRIKAIKVEFIIRNGADTYSLIEKKMNSLKITNNLFELEKELKYRLSKPNEIYTNESIEKLEEKLKEVERVLSENKNDDIEGLKEEIKNLKEIIANERQLGIENKLKELKQELDVAKEELASIDEEFNCFSIGNRVVKDDIAKISKLIKDLEVPKEGRLQYKLMPPEIKGNINSITDKILNLPQYARFFESYLNSVAELTKLYTDKIEDIEEAKSNAKDDIYNRVGNSILKTKRDMMVESNQFRVNTSNNYAVQSLLMNVFKVLSMKTNMNDNTRKLFSKSKSQRKEFAKKMRAKGLYSDRDLGNEI